MKSNISSKHIATRPSAKNKKNMQHDDIANMFGLKKESQSGRVLFYTMAIIFLAQLLWVLWANFNVVDGYLTYDASSGFLLTQMSAEQGSFWVDNFNHGRILGLDEPLFIAQVLAAVSGNPIFAWGIAKTLVLFFLVIVTWKLTGEYLKHSYSRLVALNLLIANFAVLGYSGGAMYQYNDLGYTSMLFLGIASYSLRLCIMLLVLYCVLSLVKGELHPIACGLAFIGCFLSSLSFGFYLVLECLIPCVIFLVLLFGIGDRFFKECQENISTNHLIKTAVFIVVCFGVSLLGRLAFNVFVGGSEGLEQQFVWRDCNSLFSMIGLSFGSFFDLFGVLSSTKQIDVISTAGIFTGLAVVVLLALFLSAHGGLAKSISVCKDFQPLLFFCVMATGVFIVIFSSVATVSAIQPRYLLSSILMLFLLVAFFVDVCDLKTLSQAFLMLCLIFCFAVVEAKSDYSTTTAHRFINEEQSLIEEIDEVDSSPVVFFLCVHDVAIEGTWSKGMSVLDKTRTYKQFRYKPESDKVGLVSFLTYTDFNSLSGYHGTVLVICHVNETDYLDRLAGNYQSIGEWGEYGLYRVNADDFYETQFFAIN